MNKCSRGQRSPKHDPNANESSLSTKDLWEQLLERQNPHCHLRLRRFFVHSIGSQEDLKELLDFPFSDSLTRNAFSSFDSNPTRSSLKLLSLLEPSLSSLMTFPLTLSTLSTLSCSPCSPYSPCHLTQSQQTRARVPSSLPSRQRLRVCARGQRMHRRNPRLDLDCDLDQGHSSSHFSSQHSQLPQLPRISHPKPPLRIPFDRLGCPHFH